MMWSSDKLIILEFGYLLTPQVLRSLGKKEKQPPVERDLVQWVNFLCGQSKFSKSKNGKYRGIKEVGDFLKVGHYFTTHHPAMSSFSPFLSIDFVIIVNTPLQIPTTSWCLVPCIILLGNPLTPPCLLCTEWVSRELKCAFTVPCDISFEWAMSPSEKGLSPSSLNFKLPVRSHSLQSSTSLDISVKKNWSNPARSLYCLRLNPRSVFLPFALEVPPLCERPPSLLCAIKTLPSCFSRFVSPEGGASGKEPACQCRRHEEMWVPSLGLEDPWRRAWQPTPVFMPGEPHGQRSLVGYSPWGHKE